MPPTPHAVDLAEMLGRFSDHWSPQTVARLNDYEVKAVKLLGELPWHAHVDTDELFLVKSGQLTIRLRDGEVRVGPGQLVVVPRGVEHSPHADEEVEALLIEPSGVVNTGGAGGPMTAAPERALPPLAAEDHRCATCGIDYPATSLEAAVATILTLPDALRAAIDDIPEGDRHRRPDPSTWSVTEYACHVRDVYTTSTIRLYRARTEEEPSVEPMLNDLRAARFAYNEREVGEVLGELGAAVRGFCDEVARTGPEAWSRTVTRLPWERRTAAWLVRHALHEGVHHLGDIRANVIG